MSMKSMLKRLSRLLSDKTFVKIKYRMKFKRKLNLKNPQSFNEKLQWLKLYNRKPEYCDLVDKYEVKKIVAVPGKLLNIVAI